MVHIWKEHGVFRARIEHVEPPHRLTYRWALVPDEQPRSGNSTLVEFTLAADGEHTRLRVVETGFTSLDGSEARRARHYSENVDGWHGAFTALQAYISQLATA